MRFIIWKVRRSAGERPDFFSYGLKRGDCFSLILTADQLTMTAEDMSEFLSRVPGCFFFIGSANAAKGLNAPHHNPHFDIDEDVLPLGVAVLASTALRYLNGE